VPLGGWHAALHRVEFEVETPSEEGGNLMPVSGANIPGASVCHRPVMQGCRIPFTEAIIAWKIRGLDEHDEPIDRERTE
jgi:hypothetical protein